VSPAPPMRPGSLKDLLAQERLATARRLRSGLVRLSWAVIVAVAVLVCGWLIVKGYP
jgi:hypothetical protein